VKPGATEKEFLQPRDYKIDLAKNVGKMQVVSSAVQPGFYCNVCECVIKDSINYLDHVNGKRRKLKQREREALVNLF
jgi:U4/U6.U5 tri-snRNP component SNU23